MWKVSSVPDDPVTPGLFRRFVGDAVPCCKTRPRWGDAAAPRSLRGVWSFRRPQTQGGEQSEQNLPRSSQSGLGEGPLLPSSHQHCHCHEWPHRPAVLPLVTTQRASLRGQEPRKRSLWLLSSTSAAGTGKGRVWRSAADVAPAHAMGVAQHPAIAGHLGQHHSENIWPFLIGSWPGLKCQAEN